MTNKSEQRALRHPPNVEICDADIEFLWEATLRFNCKELWDLWCLRVARHNDVSRFTAEERSEFFSEYSTVITKMRHAADTGYVFQN
ncbi:MAG: hypothetical protein ABJM29_11865 [Rhizobiaceae bacterium]